MSSFKVPCPSCEAPVLIKNSDLIGTKVECPKCKYRFKVEEPAPAAGAGGAATATKDKTDKKDKKADKKEKKAKAPGGKNKKLVPIVVGVLAVVILGGVGFAVLGKGGKKEDPFNKAQPRQANQGGGDTPSDEQPKDERKDTKPILGGSDKVTTNLLPGQAVAVYRFNVEPLRGSPAYEALVDQQIAQMFQGTLGFALDDVETYLHCYAGDGRDPFGVIKLKVPAKAPDLLAAMPVQPKPKVVKTRDLYSFRTAPFLKAVSNALAMRALFGDLYSAVPMMPTAAQTDKPFGLCVYDTQHVLIGDYALLERYLGELGDNGYPPFKSEMNTASAPPPTTTPAPDGVPPMGAPGAVTPVAPVPPKTPAPMVPAAPPGPGDKVFTSTDAYRTIEFSLKRALDDQEADRTVVPLLVYAEKFDARQYDPKLMKKDYRVLATTLDPIAIRTRYLSGNVTTFSRRQLVANLRITFGDQNDASEMAKEKLAPGLAIAAEVLKLHLTTAVDFRDYTVPGAVLPGAGVPGMGFPGSGVPGSGVPGSGFPGMSNYPGGIPGMGTPGKGPPGPIVPGLPRGAPPGGGAPTIPGGSAPPGIPMGGPPGIPMGGPLGYPMGGPPGTGPFGSGIPGTIDPKNSSASHIDLFLVDSELLIAIDITWTDSVFRTVIGPRMMGVSNQVKGKMAVYSAESGPHVLAQAGPKALAANKVLPRGTLDRARTDPSRLGMEYPPIQRVSLFVDLLPYLGRGQLKAAVDKNFAWYDERNLAAGGAWVPELLVPSYPQSAWRATSPLYAPDAVFGATNYVAVSGTGLDSARYNPNDPASKKLVGMTGYNWGSKAEDVTDGLANTIYLMQTPPGLQQPWIAGGGATVRGFDENDPMNGFRYNQGGKPGTYALMGDGSVRFIPSNIDKKVLLALGTRAGGEALADVDTHAPRTDLPKVVTTDLKGAPPPPKSDDKKGTDPMAPKPEPGAMSEVAPAPREKK